MTVDGFELVEINPRLGGALVGEAICQSLDINVHDAFFDLALGHRPALMDSPLVASRGAAQVLLYAPKTGNFGTIAGQDCLVLHPGSPVIYPLRQPGDAITATTDQSGVVGVLFATGDSAELALHNALSMAGKLHITMNGSTA
jgi:biotin carboxylase